jgi:hypothetical protein
MAVTSLALIGGTSPGGPSCRCSLGAYGGIADDCLWFPRWRRAARTMWSMAIRRWGGRLSERRAAAAARGCGLGPCGFFFVFVFVFIRGRVDLVNRKGGSGVGGSASESESDE